jgi:hypothetical protein
MLLFGKPFNLVPVVLLLFFGVAAFAQPGPDLSCEDCPEFSDPPLPETGIWGNPDQTGLGFMLEVQGGRVGGFYFGYDDSGEATWYMVAGELEAIDEPVRGWRLVTELEALTDGPCINCPWQSAELAEPGGEVEFVFEQRAFGRYRIDQGPWQNVQPLVFGSLLAPLLEDQTPYLFPAIEGYWSVTVATPSIYRSKAVKVKDFHPDEDDSSIIRAQIFSATNGYLMPTPAPALLGELYCGPQPDAGSPLCVIELDEFDGAFRMPVANLTDRYFRAEHLEQPWVMEAHRLNYD